MLFVAERDAAVVLYGEVGNQKHEPKATQLTGVQNYATPDVG